MGTATSRQSLLIEGNFSPTRLAQGVKLMRLLAVVLGMILLVTLLVSVILYGQTVEVARDINQTAEKTRLLREENEKLGVTLGRLQSFDHVELSAQALEALHHPETMIETPTTKPVKHFPRKFSKPSPPVVYGY